MECIMENVHEKIYNAYSIVKKNNDRPNRIFESFYKFITWNVNNLDILVLKNQVNNQSNE